MPADPSFTNPFTEIRNIEAFISRRRYAQAQVANMSPTSAALYANYARDYPWMQPGVIRAAAQAGYYPNNPDMVRVAAASLAEGVESGRISGGTRQRVGNLNPGRVDPMLEISGNLGPRQPPAGMDDPFAEFKAAGFINEDGELVRPARPKYKGRKNGKPVYEYDSDEEEAADKQFTNMLRQISDTNGSLKPIPYRMGGQWFNYHPKTGASEVIKAPDVASAIGGLPVQAASNVPFLGDVVERAQNVIEPTYQAAQPVLRTAGMIANAPIQEIQTTGRAIHDAVGRVQQDGLVSGLKDLGKEAVTADLSETDIGIAAEQLFSGGPVDTGSGFFVSPTSEVARERVRREAEHGQIGGHNITWGRWIASAITDPNTVPFDVMSGFVDFSIQLADPTAIGLGKAGQARQAAKLFEAEHVNDAYAAAGILGRRGRGGTVDFATAQKTFDSPRGTRAIEDITATTSAYQIAKKMSRERMDFLHDPALYDDLARTTDTTETRAILNDAINTGKVREVADLTQSWGHGLSHAVRSRMPRSKLFDKMPGIGLHLTDSKQVVNEIARHFRNVNAPEEALEEAFNKIAAQRTKSGRRNAIFDVFGSGPNSLLAHMDVDPEMADGLLRLYKESFNEMWRGLVDELGVEVPTWEHVLANGEKELVGGPHAMIELIEDWMPLPDPRRLRELTKQFPNLLAKVPEGGIKTVAVDFPKAAMDYFMQEVWKPLALLRGAWLVRVLGEGQIRIAASGMDSLFSGHPFEALGFMISQPKFGKKSVAGVKLPQLKPRVATDIKHRKWNEVREYESSLSSVHNWAYRPGAAQHTTDTTLYRKGRHHDAEYRHAWARQLLKFHYDPVYAKWIQSDSVDDMMEWFMRGEGRGFLAEYQEAFPGNMDTPEKIRKFLDEIDMRFEWHSKGNTDLFDIVRSGEWTDEAGETHSIYRGGDPHFSGNPEVNPEFTKLLANYMDYGPKKVVGQRVASTRGKSDYPALKRWVVQNLLYGAMSRSENLLARAPVFKQYYARELADAIQFGDTESRAKLIAKAEQLRVPNRTIKHMKYMASTKKPGKMNLDEMDLLAKGRAMEHAQKLLYSYSERRQIFDITRNFIPFGDAWYEVLTTWGRIMKESGGKPARRAQQIIEGSINSGFFHENRFGELAFTYPFSGALTQAVTGQPVEMEGRVQGLSMFGEVMPGLGPVAQIPAAWFLKDQPDLKELEDFLLPYGAPQGMDIINPKTYMPGWMKNALSVAGLRTAADNRLYENTIAQIADYKASTGEYGFTPEEQTRLWQDSKSDANKLYGIRVLAQFWAPAAPQLEFYTQDKSGTVLSAVALAEEFHNNEAEDFDTAVANFVDKYGTEALPALVASSTTHIPGFPDSVEGQAWINDNPQLKGKYPLVYAMFAPEGEFDIDVYTRQFASGDRQALTSKQHISLISDWLNRYHRTKYMQQMGVKTYAEMNQLQRNAWEEISALIDEQYPTAVVGISEKPELDDMIKQLEEAGKDKDILATDAGPGLQQYLALREQAQTIVDDLVASGRIDSQIKGFTKAKVLRPLREVLRANAQAIIDENPAFEPLWEHVFSRELIKE